MQLLKIECKKLFRSKSFWIALIILSLLCILQGLENLKYVRWVKSSSMNLVHPYGLDNISLKVRWIGADDYTFFGASFYMVLPLFASMAYAPSYLKENKTGSVIHFLIRTHRTEYMISKWAITFISGMLVAGIPLVLNLMINALFCPLGTVRILSLQTAVVQGSFYSTLFYEKPVIYMMLSIFLGALWGGICALIGMALSMFMNNGIIVSVAPVILLNLMGIVLTDVNQIFHITNNEVSPLSLMRAACHNKNPEEYVWTYCGAFFLIVSIVILRRGVRREII